MSDGERAEVMALVEAATRSGRALEPSELARVLDVLRELDRELRAATELADERWQAIERLAPAAKRLRSERDQLQRQLGLAAETNSSSLPDDG